MYTPVDIKHMGWGPRVAFLSLMMTLVVNILIMGMAYQRLVSTTSHNAAAITDIRSVDVQLMQSISEMARAVSSLTTSVQFLTEDVSDMRQEIRDHRDRAEP